MLASPAPPNAAGLLRWHAPPLSCSVCLPIPRAPHVRRRHEDKKYTYSSVGTALRVSQSRAVGVDSPLDWKCTIVEASCLNQRSLPRRRSREAKLLLALFGVPASGPVACPFAKYSYRPQDAKSGVHDGRNVKEAVVGSLLIPVVTHQHRPRQEHHAIAERQAAHHYGQVFYSEVPD